MAEKRSGLDSLLDALKQSGVNFDQDSPFGGGSSSSGSGSSGSGGQPPQRPEINFAEKFSQWGKRALIIAAVALVVIIIAAYWWFHPAINIHSTDTWFFVTIFILLPIFLLLFFRSKTYESGTKKVKQSNGKARGFKWASYLPVLIVVVGIVGALVSQAFFPGNAERYATMLETDSLEFSQDLKEVDYSEIPVIDRDSAELLGRRTMGDIPEYVSQFEISPLYSQINYQQMPVRVSPLGYADIIKWWNNRDGGIPAYVLVNMTTQDAKIVRPDTPIYFSQSEPLERNIDRYMQLKYPFYMFDEFSFEIDDDGHPWWICPVQTRTIGLFGGRTIQKVILCDATTGETQELSLEDCPQWVDRVFPAELLIEQYNWKGAYSEGWINSWLGQQGVVQTTPGTNGNQGYNYIAKDDDVWVYTGVTSATSDSSIIGFVLVNQRTGKAHFYSVSGATEDSAMSSAEGQVQNLRYTATFPILININNQPTYFMALKDSAGLVKKYAMLDIQRYQNVATGDTVADTQKAYKALLAINGVVAESVDGEIIGDIAIGTIVHMSQAVIDGSTHFYVRLDSDDNIYDFALPGLLEIVGYMPGDRIALIYTEADPTSAVTSILDAEEAERANAAITESTQS